MTCKRRDKMRPFLRLTSVLTAILLAAASQAENKGLPELTPEELERYQFEIEESEVTVTDLSLGQRYVLSTQRREVADLAARRLGIIKLKGDKSDLSILQNIVEKKLIRQEDVRGWQGLGIVFGDVLAAEFDLHWVSYADDVGTSKALRWRKTENYVFPVTMFSKRKQFNEKIDVFAVFDKIETDIERFKTFEENRPQFGAETRIETQTL